MRVEEGTHGLFVKRALFLSENLALFGRYSKERFRFLLHVLATAVWARHTVMIVFVQADNFLEFLATIVAEVVVHGHGNLLG